MLHAFEHALIAHGPLVITLVIGLESMGLPLPGESLLIGSAVYASVTGKLSIVWVVTAGALGAILGDNAGYAIGRWGGTALLARWGPRVGLTEERQVLGRAVFRRYGGVVVFAARFIAILRTFAALLAGANRMDWRRFLAWNAVGGVVWTAAYGFGAYALGDAARRLSGPVAWVLGGAGLAVAVVVVMVVRRNEARLVRDAVAEQRAIEAGAAS